MKNKLGNIFMGFGASCLAVGFITFALGGFISVHDGDFGTPVGVIVGFILFFIGMVLIAVGAFVKNSDRLRQFNDLSKNVKFSFEMPSSNTQTKCEYCGSIFDKNSNKCPNCGAKKK